MSRARPRTGAPLTLRRILRLWHGWFGLGAAVWLILLSVTGSAIVFYDELDRWLNPDWRSIPVAVTDAPAAVDNALAEAAKAPGLTPRFVDLPNRPGETILMLGTIAGADDQARPAQVFADPRDGTVLGWRYSGVLAIDRRHIMDLVYGLHIDLMLGEAMAWFLGLVALLWSIDHVVSAILAFPSLAKWRESFAVRGRKGSLKRLFDLHRAPGVWLLPVTMTLAVSGVALTWHEESRAVVRLVSPVSERLHEEMPVVDPAPPRVGLEAAIALVEGRVGRRADSVLLLPRQGLYGVRSFDDRDIDGMGRLWTYVSMADGSIAGQRHDNGESAGDAFFAWQYPLHSGKGLGIVGRWLVFFAGIGSASLCVTGVWLWWRRLRRR